MTVSMKHKSHTSKVILFDGGMPKPAKMQIEVRWWEKNTSEFYAFQQDLQHGKIWNETPIRGFGPDWAAAMKWLEGEEAKSL